MALLHSFMAISSLFRRFSRSSACFLTVMSWMTPTILAGLPSRSRNSSALDLTKRRGPPSPGTMWYSTSYAEPFFMRPLSAWTAYSFSTMRSVTVDHSVVPSIGRGMPNMRQLSSEPHRTPDPPFQVYSQLPICPMAWALDSRASFILRALSARLRRTASLTLCSSSLNWTVGSPPFCI